MRLFIAVNLTASEKKPLLEVQEQLRSQSLSGKYTIPENLHLTLAFLGETHEEKLPVLLEIIREISFSPFEIMFNQTGSFYSRQTELWLVGAAPEQQGFSLLKDVRSQLHELLLGAGFPVDERSFKPHITIGREITYFAPIKLHCPEIIIQVDRLSLMKSENIRGRLTYTELL
jgi:2'-5' RNA ligase